MLDLGTSFLASVARDPSALAIVDGDLRLTYRQWYGRISAIVAALEELGLREGDHLVTLLQNRWEAATIHWACQFAGIIVTPLNWRSTADELDFCIDNAEARAVVYEEVAAEAVRSSAAAQACRRIAVGRAAAGEIAFDDMLATAARDAVPRASAEAWSVMLYTSGTTAQAQGRAAPPARRTRRGARPCGAESLSDRRAHARRHAALSHHGRALAAGDVADRRRVRLPAALRRRPGAGADRGRADHQSLSGADALPRPAASRALHGRRRQLGAQARLRRRLDDRRPAQATAPRHSSRSCSSITTARRRSTPSPSTRTRPPSPAPPAAPASTRWSAWCGSAPARRTRSCRRGEEGEIIALLAGDESFEGYWRRPDADAKALRDGWYFTGDTGYFDADGDLFVTGRVDDMIITGGENVSPVEIESCLSLHPAVSEVAVVGLPDERWGKIVAAFVKRRHPVSQDDLDQFCRDLGARQLQAAAPLRVRRGHPEIAGRQALAPQAGGGRIRGGTRNHATEGRDRMTLATPSPAQMRTAPRPMR